MPSQESVVPLQRQQIKDLTPRSRRVDVVVHVTSLSPERRVVSRRDRRAHRVAEAVVEDDTGSIRLTLWDDDIDAVRVGDTLRVRNGYVKRYRGSKRLKVGQRGTLETVEGRPSRTSNTTRIPSDTPERQSLPFPDESPQGWWSYGSAV